MRRGVTLPWGSPADPADADTVAGLQALVDYLETLIEGRDGD